MAGKRSSLQEQRKLRNFQKFKCTWVICHTTFLMYQSAQDCRRALCFFLGLLIQVESNVFKHVTPHQRLVFVMLRAHTIAKQQEYILLPYSTATIYLFLSRSCQDKTKCQGRDNGEKSCMLQQETKRGQLALHSVSSQWQSGYFFHKAHTTEARLDITSWEALSPFLRSLVHPYTLARHPKRITLTHQQNNQKNLPRYCSLLVLFLHFFFF